MIKRTRMIVVTKEKIIVIASLVILITLCIILLFAVSTTKHKEAFADYENIISRQILPTENQKTTKNYGKELLKYMFKFDNPPQPTPTPTPTEKPEEPPLIESESLTIDNGMKIRNATSYSVDLNEYANKKLSLKGNANILIVHTHTTESYADTQYKKDAPDRNLDEHFNMIAIGNAINDVFKKHGIKSVHDRTVHDYPSYNSSYQKACATIEKNLKNDNSINIVLDIHRDGITRDDGTKVKLITDINGTPTAQIMLVVGTNTNLKHDNWQENLTFASHIQKEAEKIYPGLMRPIDLRKERFNQELTVGSLIIEVGANGNTLEEAIEGGKAIAEVISAVVK